MRISGRTVTIFSNTDSAINTSHRDDGVDDNTNDVDNNCGGGGGGMRFRLAAYAFPIPFVLLQIAESVSSWKKITPPKKKTQRFHLLVEKHNIRHAPATMEAHSSNNN